MENQESGRASLSLSLTLGKSEVGSVVGISARTVSWKLVHAPEELPPSIKLGRRVVWLRGSVEAWLKAQEIKQRAALGLPLIDADALAAERDREESLAGVRNASARADQAVQAKVKRGPGRPPKLRAAMVGGAA